MADLLPNGVGGLVADSLITAKPLQIKGGRVWYVDSQTGDDTNSGRDRKFAKATLGAAITAAGANDDHLVICMAGHDEEIGTTVVLSQRVTIVGEGATAGVPSVKISGDGNPGHMIEVEAAQCEIRNIHFDGIDGPDQSYLVGNAAACLIDGCHFDMTSEQTDEVGVSINAACTYWRFVNCTFAATSTTTPVVNRPQPALQTQAAIVGLYMKGVIFDGGDHGFDNGSGLPYAFDASIGAVTAIRSLNMSLLRGADFKLHTDSRGYVSVPLENATGHAKIEW